MQELRWIPQLLSKYVPRSRRKDFNRDLAIAQGAVIFFGLMLYAYVCSPWPWVLSVLPARCPASPGPAVRGGGPVLFMLCLRRAHQH